ncbi:MAG: hypothetical protein U1D30_19385 [Planctomycetota bacterium]
MRRQRSMKARAVSGFGQPVSWGRKWPKGLPEFFLFLDAFLEQLFGEPAFRRERNIPR